MAAVKKERPVTALKKEGAMTALIMQELRARKVAQVIAVVKSPEPVPRAAAEAPSGTVDAESAGGVVRSLTQHFVSSELSQISALAAAADERSLRARGRGRHFTPPPEPVRYYPNLGVMLGTVDEEGFDALSKAPEVAAVTGAPPIRFIRPVRVEARASLTGVIRGAFRPCRVPELWGTRPHRGRRSRGAPGHRCRWGTVCSRGCDSVFCCVGSSSVEK